MWRPGICFSGVVPQRHVKRPIGSRTSMCVTIISTTVAFLQLDFGRSEETIGCSDCTCGGCIGFARGCGTEVCAPTCCNSVYLGPSRSWTLLRESRTSRATRMCWRGLVTDRRPAMWFLHAYHAILYENCLLSGVFFGRVRVGCRLHIG